MDASATGIASVTPPSQCKERSCISVPSGGFLTIPAINLGQFSELSFAVWFRPSDRSGTFARIFDFANIQTQSNIAMGRSGQTDSMVLAVTRQNVVTELQTARAWMSSFWTHVVWTLSPTIGQNSTWRIYVNGVLSASNNAYFPEDSILRTNFIGKSNKAGHGAFIGLLDSFMIYSVALSARDVALLPKVRT